MPLNTTFKDIQLSQLLDLCQDYKDRGYRMVQLCPKLEHDDSITLIYTLGMGEELVNLKVSGIVKGETPVPSVTGMFIAAFVFENEAHDLFGVNVEGNAIDFKGKFYRFAEGVEAPMTIISPEQLAAREKAAKLAKAKAAREAKAKAKAEAAKAGQDAKPAADKPAAVKPKATEEDLEAKLKDMDPEKAAKVRAAMEAKAKRAAAKAAAEKEGE